MQQGFQLREVFNPAVVDQLAHNIARTWPTFDQIGFATTINSQLVSLNFGARNTLIRDTLWAYLPKEFPQAVQILVDSLGPEIPHCEITGFDGFIIMPQNDFVAKYGLDFFDISMQALYAMTKRFTAEGAIRAFIQKYPDQTLARLRQWAEDPNCHVRRLVSEGTRPRLPLAPRLGQFIRDPRPVLALLDQLKADPELMVRRSVANNLNDIAKDHPVSVGPFSDTLAQLRTCGCLQVLLLRFQLARVRLILFGIVFQFLEELCTDSAHEELQQRRQKHTWEQAHVKLGTRFH